MVAMKVFSLHLVNVLIKIPVCLTYPFKFNLKSNFCLKIEMIVI